MWGFRVRGEGDYGLGFTGLWRFIFRTMCMYSCFPCDPSLDELQSPPLNALRSNEETLSGSFPTYWDPIIDPKLRTAQKAIILHSFGVQV